MDTQWITTPSGNTISRTAVIPHPQSVIISGHSTIGHKVSLGSDSLQLGKFVYLDENTIVDSTPCKIGSYVIVGADCHLSCSNIGNRVYIGANVTALEKVVIHDCVIVKAGTFINKGVNIPPFSLVEQDCVKGHRHNSRCGLSVKLLNESFKKLIENWSKTCYINHEIPSEIP